MLCFDAVLLTLLGQVGGRFPGGGSGGGTFAATAEQSFQLAEDGGARLLAAGLAIHFASLFLHLVALADEFLQPCRIEVDVGDGGEQRLVQKFVEFGILGAHFAGFAGVAGEAAQAVEQVVLQGRDIRLLAANAAYGASGSLGSLFTLTTKHDFPP
jgi:hypothetical protein